jgi:hypothetical protein
LKTLEISKKLEEDNGEIDGVDGSETERSLDDKRSQDIADREQKFAEKSAQDNNLEITTTLKSLENRTAQHRRQDTMLLKQILKIAQTGTSLC